MINKMSKRWSDETKDLVNNSKLNLLRVYDNTFIDTDTIDILEKNSLEETCHCDFCGQRIKYVSILEFNKQSENSYFQIGKECMSYLFDYGMKINGLDHAKFQIESAVKKLIKESSQRSRIEKYSKEFKVYLDWLDSLDSNFIEKNEFLSFINQRLRTGNGVVTQKMVSALERMIKRYTPESTAHLDETRKKLLEKIGILIDDIKIVYDNYESNGTYKFVSSVYEWVDDRGNATKRQLEALNKVSDRIKSLKKKCVEDKLNKMFNKTQGDDADIPW